jgi:hypothetical protein
MVLSSTLSNCLIEGNTTDFGFSTPDGSSTNSYNYLTALSTNADCRIMQNTFSGVASGSNVMADLFHCSCEIQSNTFIRNTNTLLAYLRSDGYFDHMIVDNIFDQNTIDGSNTSLITGFSATTIYQRNKNQIGYAIIPMTTQVPSLFNYAVGGIETYYVQASSDVPPSVSTDFGVTTGAFLDRFAMHLYDDSASPAQRTLGLGLDTSKSIPLGTRILDAKISVFNPSTIPLDLTSVNQFQLSLDVSRNHTLAIDTKTYSSQTVPTWMLNFSSTVKLTISSGLGNEPSMRSAYQVIDLNPTNFTTGTSGQYSYTATNSAGTTLTQVGVDNSNNYVSTSDSNIVASLTFFYRSSLQGSSNTPLIVVSPLIVTYTW